MLRILHLEDSATDALFVEKAIRDGGISAKVTLVKRPEEFTTALEHGNFDLILSDNSLPSFTGLEALQMVRQKFPSIGFICVSGAAREQDIANSLKAGANDYVLKDHPWQIRTAVKKEQERLRLERRDRGMSRLVMAVQELSLARDLDSIMAIVRRAAREMTGADGATFVLRDGEFCHYVDEYAIAPLWKGQRFPLKTCISGWAMLNSQPAVIEDIYADSRIPADAYRPTFVKSLAMVPIRTESPIGAIGNYWATQRMPSKEEVELLQALANTIAVAMENVQVYKELEQRVKDRTAQLQSVNAQLHVANRELETFSYSVSHDLGTPLRSVRMFTEMVLSECGPALTASGRDYLEKIHTSTVQMRELIDDLLRLAKIARTELTRETLDVTAMAKEIVSSLSAGAPERKVEVNITPGMEADADRGLVRIVLENLISNAWKYSGKNAQAKIECGTVMQADGVPAYFVRDNGAGFDMKSVERLFQPFQRLHSHDDFPGSGIGLTTVQRIVQRHGGKIWAEAEVNKGATFYFTLAAGA